MDKNIQKAFINGIPKCFEHQGKLAIGFKRNTGLSVCWLDLAIANGNVHHQLIHFTLKHYLALSMLVHTVVNLYTNLNVTITTQEFPPQIR